MRIGGIEPSRLPERRNGQATVEFALIVVLVVTTFFAIIEFSWVFYNMAYLHNAVNKAAREYIKQKYSSDSQAWTAAQTVLVAEQGGLTITSFTRDLLDGSTLASGATRTAGNFVRIDATMTYPSITPMYSLIQLFNLTTLRSVALQRCE